MSGENEGWLTGYTCPNCGCFVFYNREEGGGIVAYHMCPGNLKTRDDRLPAPANYNIQQLNAEINCKNKTCLYYAPKLVDFVYGICRCKSLYVDENGKCKSYVEEK